MAKTIVTGTGSTRRARRSLSTRDPLDERPMLSALKDWADEGDPFTARLQSIEVLCKGILDAASLAHDAPVLLAGPPAGEEDTPEGYALRILNRLHFLRLFLNDGNASLAADFALDLGHLLGEAGLKPLADQAFKAAIGRARGDANRQKRNAAIMRDFEARVARGIPRKAAIEDMMVETGLSDRQLRSIIPPARRK